MLILQLTIDHLRAASSSQCYGRLIAVKGNLVALEGVLSLDMP